MTPDGPISSKNWKETLFEAKENAFTVYKSLETRVYRELKPENSLMCKKLLCALPISFSLNLLSPLKTLATAALAGAYFWRAKEEIFTNKTKIELLHAFAISFFGQLLSSHVIEKPLHLVYLMGSLYLANQIEGQLVSPPSTIAREKEK